MKAMVTGATGQCGSYLCEFLLKKGYEVCAIIRRNTLFDPANSFLKDCIGNPKFHISKGDVNDASSINSIVERFKPNECYNAASQSHVHDSFFLPQQTFITNAVGTLNCLEAIRIHSPNCRFLQFSTSELFGKATEEPQNELTKFYPQSPYAISKLAAYWATINVRESYDFFASNGIFFNMESPRRGKDFVTQKIVRGGVLIKKQIDIGKKVTPICLGNLKTKRDWNDARESIEYAWKILQQKEPNDFVIGSGKCHPIEDFIKEVLNYLKIGYEERENFEFGQNEFFFKDGQPIVIISEEFFRPAEVYSLRADFSKAKKVLGYEPKATLKSIVKDMVEAALQDSSIKP